MDFFTFYNLYLLEHLHPDNRLMHYIGSMLAILLMILFLFTRLPMFLILMPLLGYGFAWFGHFRIEKNRPTTFKYPFYSFCADFLMLYHFLTFQIDRKIKKAKENKLS